MAYMMVAPINLKNYLEEAPTLYLIGRKALSFYEDFEDYNAAHDPDITEEQFNALLPSEKIKTYERKVYKAELSKLNLQAGKHHQWVPAASPDSPIEFQNISIQEWENGPGFTNTDGDGTEDW